LIEARGSDWSSKRHEIVVSDYQAVCVVLNLLLFPEFTEQEIDELGGLSK
jgi:hypothetical protein